MPVCNDDTDPPENVYQQQNEEDVFQGETVQNIDQEKVEGDTLPESSEPVVNDVDTNLLSSRFKILSVVDNTISPLDEYDAEMAALNAAKLEQALLKIEEFKARGIPTTQFDCSKNDTMMQYVWPHMKPQPAAKLGWKTLVLDLDNTLIYSSKKSMDNPDLVMHNLSTNSIRYVKFRDGLQEFLNEVSQLFEVGIFTAAEEAYANAIIDQIDTSHILNFRLYRQHTTIIESGWTVKDLSKLPRNINQIVIVDDLGTSFCMQPFNGILVAPFRSETPDEVLGNLLQILRKIHQQPDVYRWDDDADSEELESEPSDSEEL